MAHKHWIITMIVLTAFQVAFTDSSLSQSLYLNKGESGFGFEGGYGWSKHFSGVSGAIGYSHRGVLDFVVSAANSQPADLNIEFNSYGLSTQLYLIKNDDRGKISAALGAGYFRKRASKRSADFQEESFATTVIFSGKGEPATKLTIFPVFSLSRIFPLGDGPGVKFFVAGVDLSFGLTMNHSIFIISTGVSKPFRSFSDVDETSFSVGLGLIFSPN